MPRLKYGSLARVVFILCLFCLWLQIMLSASSGGLYREEELMNANETSEQVLAMVPAELHKYLTVYPKNVSANATEKTSPKNITEIRRAIQRYNEAQIIYNEDIFGPVQNDTIIIAIQVHTRLTYLRHLIVSLAQAKDIDRTLLVFSHDYYDEEINALVRSIDFTKVMQIFYPYSIQVHPNEFPGMDPNDCPRDAKFQQAIKLKCNNALHPDLHGHYREAKYTQTKHHWWWKANRIFNQLQCTTSHTGMVVFLEEDHYVAEDFIHMLNLLRTTADQRCPHCEILSLGTYLKTYQYHVSADKRKKQLTLNYIQQVKAANEERRRRIQETQAWNYQVYPNLYSSTQKWSDFDGTFTQLCYKEQIEPLFTTDKDDINVLKIIGKFALTVCVHLKQKIQHQLRPLYIMSQVEITPWHSSMHNMGFVFNRTVWNSIMEIQHQFCAYDDYNWDYSLLHLSQNRPGKEKFKVILCKGPRVFHIGECGFHHKKSNCNASTVISKVQKLLLNAKKYLFPSRVTATVTAGGAKHNKKLTKGNGGWGDLRDQELCTNMTKVGREARKFYTNI